jgi:hypothetical protein
MIELPQSSCLWKISMEIFVFEKKKKLPASKKLFLQFFSEYSDAIKSYFELGKKSELN